MTTSGSILKSQTSSNNEPHVRTTCTEVAHTNDLRDLILFYNFLMLRIFS